MDRQPETEIPPGPLVKGHSMYAWLEETRNAITAVGNVDVALIIMLTELRLLADSYRCDFFEMMDKSYQTYLEKK